MKSNLINNLAPDDYHQLGIFKKGSRKSDLPLLYSVKHKSMMIREYDIYKDSKMIQTPNINVYKFDIPNRALEILKKHEQKLPPEGDFINSWPG
jgi:hypothetical protein